MKFSGGGAPLGVNARQENNLEYRRGRAIYSCLSWHLLTFEFWISNFSVLSIDDIIAEHILLHGYHEVGSRFDYLGEAIRRNR